MYYKVILSLIIIVFIVVIIYFYWCYEVEKNTNEYLIKYYKVKGVSMYENLKNITNEKIDIKTVYINLEKNSDRKKKIEDEAKFYKVKNIERFNAINGYNIDDIKGGKIQGIEFSNNINCDEKGGLGCTLSHLTVIKNFYDSDEEWILILEDDMDFIFLPYWDMCLSEMIKKIPTDAYFLYLTYTTDNFDNREGYILSVEENDDIGSSGAYLINRKGAKKLIDIFYKENKIVLDKDVIKKFFIDIGVFKKLNRYKLKYLHFPNFNPQFESSIGGLKNFNYVKENNIKNIEYYLDKIGDKK
jgi:GR25 family glycosyltransferase involved in LPS biosynthesis